MSTREQILGGLSTAMRAENDGHYFYLMAAQNTNDPQGKQVFEQLARDELTHLEFLRKQHAALTETGTVDKALDLGAPTTFAATHPIFSEAIQKRVGEAHYEMTALSVAIQLEAQSHQFYAEQAARNDDTTIKRFYTKLAAWEQGHFDALSRQYDELKEDYWGQNRFAPF
jgi:rubrerythrin